MTKIKAIIILILVGLAAIFVVQNETDGHSTVSADAYPTVF